MPINIAASFICLSGSDWHAGEKEVPESRNGPNKIVSLYECPPSSLPAPGPRFRPHWAIERLFGWDQAGQRESFAEWFKHGSIVTARSADGDWIQQRPDRDTIFSVQPTSRQRRRGKGISTRVIPPLPDLTRQRSQAVTLGVMKSNPALALYERLGFRLTHEDEYKLYMRA